MYWIPLPDASRRHYDIIFYNQVGEDIDAHMANVALSELL